ncbi:MAG: O-antigen ligase family protein [candidate division KSB1 bacterium]|nr:O-antigen ligase family protein [candidate division KSB1 bacterium]MDZ7272497.1 O-antigen ligase family protein [candidate division KSB1 bacterium]MDZ7284479.1 O-antigen ligase family protein [candidate division KSB1 bacterium]MDZ7297125.1 O-antigen ligase family protein [candidate division KSB1 bacterium]MDZ7306573.1 O-antigen ligase family protein [candidate division KSB1 bacterium]
MAVPAPQLRCNKWLTLLQAFALFALAAFVNFSIAGAHMSLGLLTLTLVLQFVRRGTHGTWTALTLGFEWPLLAFTLACVLATVLSETPAESLRNLRHLLTVLGAYGVAHSLRHHPGWRRPLLWTFVAVAAGTAGYGLLRFLLGAHVKVMATQSTTMTWGALAAMFALIATQVALAAPSRRERGLAMLALLPQLPALLFSMVRGAYVGYAAGVLYLLARQWRRALPIAAAVLVVAFLFSPVALQQRMLSIFDPSVTTTQVRLVQWQYALQIFADHPLFGVGWRDLAALTRNYAPPGTDFNEGIAYDVFHIGHYHSTYFTLLVSVGAVGLLAFGWLMVEVWRRLGRVLAQANPAGQSLVRAVRAAMIGFLVAGLFDWTFGDAEVVTMFWFLIGYGLGQVEPRPAAPAGMKPAVT